MSDNLSKITETFIIVANISLELNRSHLRFNNLSTEQISFSLNLPFINVFDNEPENYENINEIIPCNNIEHMDICEQNDNTNLELSEESTHAKEESVKAVINKDKIKAESNAKNVNSKKTNQKQQNKIRKTNGCDVCGHVENYIDNSIFTCCVCKEQAHQTCYGGEIWSPKVKLNTKWTCEVCIMNYKGNCHFCGQDGGIMRQYNGEWMHIFCLEWNSTCTYEKVYK
jgi:hypothetical protein